MKKTTLILFSALTALCSLTFAQNTKLNQATHPSIDEMKSRFVNPGRDYATAPLWVWNDLLTDDQIRHTMQDLAAQNVKQVFVHPRPGLMTPYLSEDWFHLWKTAFDEAEKLDMNVWIYDENSYPTGFAGGLVPEAMPDSRGKGLSVFRRDAVTDARGNWTAGPDIVYVVQVQADGSKKDLSQLYRQTKAGKLDSEFLKRKADGVTWLLGQYKWAGASQWYGGMYYVDLMKPGVTEKFIEITHEAYKKHIGDQFGKRCPGIFSDEAQITPAGHLSWTDDLPEVFEKQHGYSIVENLNSLVEETGDWRRVRHDYYQTLLWLFTERWSKPVYNWCEANGMEWTGHYWEHGWPSAAHGPDSMAMYYWHQRPAIDMLLNQYDRGGGQFGNARSGRELMSVAHQMGRARTLSENFGASGWDVRFEDLKRLGDWSYAVGVNTTDEHLSYISIRGARKHDHPQSFSYHAPWFEQYKHLEDYWTRLSYMLSSGEISQARFLLIEPTTTAWMYQNVVYLDRIGHTFRGDVISLEERQADYDIGSEYIIAREGRISESGKFVVGKAQYDYVVLPRMIENIDVPTLKLLAQYVKQKGQIISLGGKILFVEGLAVEKQSADIQKMASDINSALQFKAIVELDLSNQAIRVDPQSAAADTFHLLRQTENAFILFICNASLEACARGTIQLGESLKGSDIYVEQFDPFTGKISEYSGLNYNIPPCGSLLLTFTIGKKSETLAKNKTEEDARIIVPTKDWTTKRLDDNVLLIDYLDVQIGDETHKNQYFYPANAWLWQKNGFSMSPWDNGVQLRDNLLKHQFADNSGFTQTYRFTVAEGFKPGKLQFVCENPTGYHVTVNGTPVDPIPGAWKFDRSFGVYDIAKLVKTGENIVTLKADKMTIFHEIMPAWVVGEFSLESAAQGFIIVPDRGLQAPKDDEIEPKPQVHSNDLEGVSWLNSGCDYSAGVRDLAPAITFTFLAKQSISGIRVWNYNEANLETRGVKEAQLFADGVSVGTFTFKKGDSTAETILFDKPIACKELTFKILSNWKGITYPLDESFVGSKREINGNDNAFVGLAEVQFLTNIDGKETIIPNVFARATTEFNNRLARFTVNGSGLDINRPTGWAGQGAPFYSGAVDYSKRIIKANGKTYVALPPIRDGWNGAVAVVLVNGKQVGTIALREDKVDITDALHDGENEVVVRIYATPKNLYGPHHIGRLRGSAWPYGFHRAPATMPAGSSYDVIPYGLFK